MMAVTRGYRLFWYRLRKTDIVISYNTSLLFGLWSRLTITWHGGEPGLSLSYCRCHPPGTLAHVPGAAGVTNRCPLMMTMMFPNGRYRGGAQKVITGNKRGRPPARFYKAP